MLMYKQGTPHLLELRLRQLRVSRVRVVVKQYTAIPFCTDGIKRNGLL